MNPYDLFAAEPLLPLLAFHRRTERHLAQLAALASEMAVARVSPRLCASASMLLHGLGDARAEHHVLEEARLLPGIERRIREAPDLEEFRRMRRCVAEDHGGIAQAWRPLRRPLEAIAEGVARPIDHDAVAAFRALCSRHIVAEETALHRFALRYLRGREAA